MHAASRQSLAEARERLDAYVDRASPDDLATLADELFAVVALLDREPVLRRALSDPAAEPQARSGLLDAVLGQRLGQGTLDQLRPLVQARWSTPGNLADAVEALARQATLGVAERDGTLDEVEDELFRFSRILDSQPRLRALLADAAAPADRRVGLLDELIEGKVNAATRRLLDQAVRAPRGRSLEVAVEQLVRLAAERHERYIAYVQAPAPLTPEQESRLAATLSRIYGRAVSVRVDVDPELLGGLVVTVNEEVIDGSVAHRLDEVRQRLAG
jgi:F-type H+-transporting ATPase subunit delta